MSESIEKIKSIVDSHWAESNQPILLSNLQPKIIEQITKEEYEKLLNGKTLKKFLEETSSNEVGYRVVIHPDQPAKVGAVPFGTDFYYGKVTSNKVTPSIDKEATTKKPNRAVALLRILSLLSDDDLEKINIPASVFVKLYKSNGQ